MSIFELSVYSPTIEETWKDSGIRRLKIEGVIGENWSKVLEAVVYKTSKYLAHNNFFLPPRKGRHTPRID